MALQVKAAAYKRRPKFDPCSPQGERREQTSVRCSLISTRASACISEWKRREVLNKVAKAVMAELMITGYEIPFREGCVFVLG